MKNEQPYRIKTISEYHQFRGLPKPEHPLISVVNYNFIKKLRDDEPKSFVHDFYAIALKRGVNAKMKYGQLDYDFDEGVMAFVSPGQVFSIQPVNKGEVFHHSGWLLLVHPDFLWNTPLAKTINQHDYFSYAVHEALHLSEKEELMMAGIVQNIEQEYHANIDKFTQNIIITHLESLLSYAERFYHRQFITRKINNHQILDRLEMVLAEYFNNNTLVKNGLPTVQLEFAFPMHITYSLFLFLSTADRS
jgi:hypothetical protein